MENETRTEPTERVVASGWAASRKAASGKWLKMKDGDTVEMIITDAPKIVEKDFGKGEGPKLQYSLSLFTLESGHKTWDVGPTVFKRIDKEAQKHGENIGGMVLEVTREGSSKQDTVYMVRTAREATAAELEEAATPAPF